MSRPAADRLERSLAAVLKAGALTSTALLAAGLLLELAGVAPGVATVLIHAGLVVLMATPVARVVVSVVEYAFQRDWLFTTLTSVVLVILLGSLAVSLRG